MSSFLERLNANLEKALSKKKKKKKEDTLPENCSSEIDAKVYFVKDGNVVTPDLSGSVKDFLFQVSLVQQVFNPSTVNVQNLNVQNRENAEIDTPFSQKFRFLMSRSRDRVQNPNKTNLV